MFLQSVAEMRKIETTQPGIFSIPSSSLISEQSLGDFVWLTKSRLQKTVRKRLPCFLAFLVEAMPELKAQAFLSNAGRGPREIPECPPEGNFWFHSSRFC